MAKPKVAIVNSSSQLAICFSHLDEIARRARRALGRRPTIVLIRGSLVRDGDTVRIDIPGRTADLDMPAAELQARRAALTEPTPSTERGWLSIYQRLVRPLPEGAVLIPVSTAGDRADEH